MAHNIEIKIEHEGEPLGTLSWFESMMANSEFVIKNSKNGSPEMFLKTTNDDGKIDYSFLCKKWNINKNPLGYPVTKDGYLCEMPEGDGYYTDGFANFPLTPACRKAVEEMISKAKDAFAEWWESQ